MMHTFMVKFVAHGEVCRNTRDAVVTNMLFSCPILQDRADIAKCKFATDSLVDSLVDRVVDRVVDKVVDTVVARVCVDATMIRA